MSLVRSVDLQKSSVNFVASSKDDLRAIETVVREKKELTLTSV